ncbi:MAG: homoserine dehydrogenase [Lentisphaeraceae bacterium]|nr:homoserine dehydrogenase [Lentisphaeraceae bacterium]
MKKFKVGIIGLGTVGSGVVECFEKNGALFASRYGFEYEVTKVAVRNLDSKRLVEVDRSIMTTNPEDVVNATDVDIVLELMGGQEPARTLVLQALNNGKVVVTANKALIAESGPELFAAAEANGTRILFEASVAGGIPIIKSLQEGLSSNGIESIHGILNGTCNFILSCMEAGTSYTDALADAQRLGYAEADPTLDVGGGDAGHKAAILASLAFGQWFTSDMVSVRGIDELDLVDIEFARDAGYRIKLIANILKTEDEKVSIDVQPTLVPQASMIGSVMDVYNGIKILGNTVGDTFFYGQGAGKDATSSAVVTDVIDASQAIASGTIKNFSGFKAFEGAAGPADLSAVVSRFYLRVVVEDSPKVLSTITGILGDHNISIASITQKESHEKSVPVVILTHDVLTKELEAALNDLDSLPVVLEKPRTYRLEDFD